MSEIAKEELRARISGMSDEEKQVALECFTTKEILTELVARVMVMEKTIDNVQKAFGEK